MALPYEMLSVAGRIGGFAKASRYPPGELTRQARSAFLRRFERQVDSEGVLSPEERARRALAAKKAYFCRLAYLSAKARRSRAQRRNGQGGGE